MEQKIDNRKSCEKLILDYEPKTKYAVHYRNLQLYMQLGMKVMKIHRIFSFKRLFFSTPLCTVKNELPLSTKEYHTVWAPQLGTPPKTSS